MTSKIQLMTAKGIIGIALLSMMSYFVTTSLSDRNSVLSVIVTQELPIYIDFMKYWKFGWRKNIQTFKYLVKVCTEKSFLSRIVRTLYSCHLKMSDSPWYTLRALSISLQKSLFLLYYPHCLFSEGDIKENTTHDFLNSLSWGRQSVAASILVFSFVYWPVFLGLLMLHWVWRTHIILTKILGLYC